MRLSFVTVTLVGMTLLVTACSGGGGSSESPPAAPTDSPSAEDIASAQAIADRVLLTIEDFPAGWTQTPADPNDTDLGLTGECAVIEDDALPGELAHAISDDFVGPDEREVSSGSSVFEDEEKAAQAFSDYADTLDACRDELTTAYKVALEREFAGRGVPPDTIADLRVTFDQIDSPVSADDALAYRLLTTLSASGRPMQITFDLTFPRIGKVIGYLSYYSQGEPSHDEESQFAAIVVDKLRASDAN